MVVLLGYSGCGPDPNPEPPIEEVQLGKLKATWKASDVKLDGVNKTTDYANFQLTIAGTPGESSFGYTSSGRPALSPWPSSGSWTFGTSPETQVVRDPASANDKLDITYSVSDTQLQLTFNFARDGYARTSNVKGQWVFTFTKN